MNDALTSRPRITCIIVDDEPIARRGMERLVACRSELQLLTTLNSAEAAIDYLSDNDADLIFLDIEMPGANGMELARIIPRNCRIIFTTAYSDYAAESYEVEALDYLLKPIDRLRFNKAVDKAIACRDALADLTSRKEADANTTYITVRADRRYMRLRLADIVWVEGLKDYVVVHLTDRKVITRMTLKSIASLLPEPMFIRVNKSYIVSRDRIDSFDSNDIYIGNKEIAIGAAYRDSVLSLLSAQNGNT